MDTTKTDSIEIEMGIPEPVPLVFQVAGYMRLTVHGLFSAWQETCAPLGKR